MTEFKIGDRVRYLGVPYEALAVGTQGVIRSFGTGASGALYAHVFLDETDERWDFIINGVGPDYTGPEIEKWFDEPDTTAQQDAIDAAFARGYDEGYAQGSEDGYERGHLDGGSDW
jgi:hypothetical protein